MAFFYVIYYNGKTQICQYRLNVNLHFPTLRSFVFNKRKKEIAKLFDDLEIG